MKRLKLPIFQIDAFAEQTFKGNPAAVCPLDNWLADELLQSIASENNLSETAFFVPTDRGYQIRWFTPVMEVDLCGHATLASAFVIFSYLNHKAETICFESKSGLLKVEKEGTVLTMDFPSQPAVSCETPIEIIHALNVQPIECLKSEDYIVVLGSETELSAIEPNYEPLKKLDLRGVIITAKSDSYDFVARCFAPKYGINEDPVTGSAYTQLAPYWAEKLSKTKFHAKQLSKRGGELFCELKGNRVKISGTAIKYLEGEIEVEIN
jgi:PhzF family phenazine biosynthesis protein